MLVRASMVHRFYVSVLLIVLPFKIQTNLTTSRGEKVKQFASKIYMAARQGRSCGSSCKQVGTLTNQWLEDHLEPASM